MATSSKRPSSDPYVVGSTRPHRVASAGRLHPDSHDEADDSRISCETLLWDLPDILQGDNFQEYSKDGQSKCRNLPNLLGRSLIARFHRISRDQDSSKTHTTRWRTTPAPHVAGTSSWPAKGNVGLYVRYPEECYQFTDPRQFIDTDSDSLDRDRISNLKSAPAQLQGSLGFEAEEQYDSPEPPTISRNPTQEAIATARQARQKFMGDALSGMDQGGFMAQPSKIKLLFDKKSRRKSRAICFSAPVSTTARTEGSSRGDSSLKSKLIPGSYKFPKETDFIVPEKKLDAHGMDVSVRPKASYGERKRDFYMPTKATGPGKLCRNYYPVTEGLHKHGTSITKTKSKPLGRGEWRISKVWHRSSSRTSMHPSVMAREDIPFAERQDQAKALLQVT